MDRRVIRSAIQQIQEELGKSDDEAVDNAIYQVYCECNRFIASEIKRIMKEEGVVTAEHPEIAPLYKMFDYLLPTLKNYSIFVRGKQYDK